MLEGFCLGWNTIIEKTMYFYKIKWGNPKKIHIARNYCIHDAIFFPMMV